MSASEKASMEKPTEDSTESPIDKEISQTMGFSQFKTGNASRRGRNRGNRRGNNKQKQTPLQAPSNTPINISSTSAPVSVSVSASTNISPTTSAPDSNNMPKKRGGRKKFYRRKDRKNAATASDNKGNENPIKPAGVVNTDPVAVKEVQNGKEAVQVSETDVIAIDGKNTVGAKEDTETGDNEEQALPKPEVIETKDKQPDTSKELATDANEEARKDEVSVSKDTNVPPTKQDEIGKDKVAVDANQVQGEHENEDKSEEKPAEVKAEDNIKEGGGGSVKNGKSQEEEELTEAKADVESKPDEDHKNGEGQEEEATEGKTDNEAKQGGHGENENCQKQDEPSTEVKSDFGVGQDEHGENKDWKKQEDPAPEVETNLEVKQDGDSKKGEVPKEEKGEPEGKATNHTDKSGCFHAPNGEILNPKELEDLARGVLKENGERVYFKPSFIDPNPWKGLRPTSIACTPYRLFYDPED